MVILVRNTVSFKIAERIDFMCIQKEATMVGSNDMKLGGIGSHFLISLHFYGFGNLQKYNKIYYLYIYICVKKLFPNLIFLHIYKNTFLHVNQGITAPKWHYIN